MINIVILGHFAALKQLPHAYILYYGRKGMDSLENKINKFKNNNILQKIMWLLLFLFIFINLFYNNTATSLSVLVKISWREYGMDKDYYKHLDNKLTNRFNLILTRNGIQMNGLTNVYDLFEFKQEEEEQNVLENVYKLQVFIADLNLNIGTINNIENNSIIYLFANYDNSKFIKITNNEEYFGQMVNLIKHPVRVLQFVWKNPIEMGKHFNVKIECKEESDFSIKLNRVHNENKIEYKSKYVKSIICPNDEYSVKLFNENPTSQEINKPRMFHDGLHYVFIKMEKNKEIWKCDFTSCNVKIWTDLKGNVLNKTSKFNHRHIMSYKEEILKCDPAIHTNDKLNVYEIDFNNPITQPTCKLIKSEQRIIGQFLFILDNYLAVMDQNMEENFIYEKGTDIIGDWMLEGPKDVYNRNNFGQQIIETIVPIDVGIVNQVEDSHSLGNQENTNQQLEDLTENQDYINEVLPLNEEQEDINNINNLFQNQLNISTQQQEEEDTNTIQGKTNQNKKMNKEKNIKKRKRKNKTKKSVKIAKIYNNSSENRNNLPLQTENLNENQEIPQQVQEDLSRNQENLPTLQEDLNEIQNNTNQNNEIIIKRNNKRRKTTTMVLRISNERKRQLLLEEFKTTDFATVAIRNIKKNHNIHINLLYAQKFFKKLRKKLTKDEEKERYKYIKRNNKAFVDENKKHLFEEFKAKKNAAQATFLIRWQLNVNDQGGENNPIQEDQIPQHSTGQNNDTGLLTAQAGPSERNYDMNEFSDLEDITPIYKFVYGPSQTTASINSETTVSE
ncbi:hypothetical protein Mgra_00005137 [Meloidogyne graminicola]|uniref:Uncharacterized protein n=1 Tax=Meloidogyne graminicola TaxID=189291 RepID=A0A8S9ZQD5_9BILA|nr:hypothetical protein Mgra_00005137 [Meloidogyne graminicola]